MLYKLASSVAEAVSAPFPSVKAIQANIIYKHILIFLVVVSLVHTDFDRCGYAICRLSAFNSEILTFHKLIAYENVKSLNKVNTKATENK